ncbi:MAG TPA: thiamine-phosphate kinase, partial [Nitrospirota bacterium]
MKISALGEFGLIERIRKSSLQKSPSVLTGIGDDAAALRVAPSAALLATTDMLIEKVHFDLAYTDFYSLGWKSAAVNLSDIAAMGGLPRFCLTSLAIPSRITAEQILDFYSGFNGLLRIHRTVLAGGDTCASPDALVVSVTALGEAHRRMILTRAGAKPGDHILVTGTLGDSAAGLELLRMRGAEHGVRQGRRGKGFSSALHTPDSELVRRHLRPVPRVEWGRKIALSGCASAMIDISDGLSSDLGHVCEQSGLGAVVYSARIPLSAALRKSAGQ